MQQPPLPDDAALPPQLPTMTTSPPFDQPSAPEEQPPPSGVLITAPQAVWGKGDGNGDGEEDEEEREEATQFELRRCVFLTLHHPNYR